jgi:hypothetical protein
MVGGQHGENGVGVPELVEVDGVKERETLPTLNLITSVRGKSTRIIFIMTWNVAKHKTVHVGIPVIFLNGSIRLWLTPLSTIFQLYRLNYYSIIGDMRQVSDYLQVLWFPPPIKLTTTI